MSSKGFVREIILAKTEVLSESRSWKKDPNGYGFMYVFRD